MIGKNPLFVSRQHGHSVTTMPLPTYSHARADPSCVRSPPRLAFASDCIDARRSLASWFVGELWSSNGGVCMPFGDTQPDRGRQIVPTFGKALFTLA